MTTLPIVLTLQFKFVDIAKWEDHSPQHIENGRLRFLLPFEVRILNVELFDEIVTKHLKIFLTVSDHVRRKHVVSLFLTTWLLYFNK